MPGPDLYAVRVALEAHLFAALEPAFAAGDVIIVQPGEDIRPDLDRIQVIHSVNPGAVLDGEMGGRQGVCPREGVYVITLSSPPNDTGRLAEAWKLAGVIEDAFYREDLPVAGTECAVSCEEPYTTNVGETTDKRLALSVSIPWWIWAGGHEGD